MGEKDSSLKGLAECLASLATLKTRVGLPPRLQSICPAYARLTFSYFRKSWSVWIVASRNFQFLKPNYSG